MKTAHERELEAMQKKINDKKDEMEAALEHDCHLSPEDGCAGCELYEKLGDEVHELEKQYLNLETNFEEDSDEQYENDRDNKLSFGN